ncbi:AAA domain [Popillia japonica]|uniref:Cell division control protein n=1 Tax=Popillia japonica TaxID=7064 RepID=A0AAW1IFJ4_POPJA
MMENIKISSTHRKIKRTHTSNLDSHSSKDYRTQNSEISDQLVETGVCENKLLSNKPARANANNSGSYENKLRTPRKVKTTYDDGNEKLEPKKLFDNRNIYQNARKALHSTVPICLPGREGQLLDLKLFILQHCSAKESSTVYVSGPPGTGKTASLSIILNDAEVCTKVHKVYINCTSIKSSVTIYSRIAKDLKIENRCKTEKEYVQAIEKYLMKNHKMILLVLDEIDQLESKKQSVLYTIFEWPSRPQFQIILIGIANALDLTDRILPRLQTRLELKPKLIHFSPYTKQEIITIFTERLKEAGVCHVFAPVALQMLAGKVAAISGDVRRALDIGRRVIELVEQNRKQDVLKSLENFEIDADIDGIKPLEEKVVDLTQVVNVLNNVYGTTNTLNSEDDDCLPLQQKLILCTLLLLLANSKNKDITIGKLHDMYKKAKTDFVYAFITACK